MIKKFIIKTNKAYDKLNDNLRFMIMLILISPFIFTINYSTDKYYILAAGIWTILITLWRISFFKLIEKQNKK